jgi:hypothetical protein
MDTTIDFSIDDDLGHGMASQSVRNDLPQELAKIRMVSRKLQRNTALTT